MHMQLRGLLRLRGKVTRTIKKGSSAYPACFFYVCGVQAWGQISCAPTDRDEASGGETMWHVSRTWRRSLGRQWLW
jgi:hypothetical protein